MAKVDTIVSPESAVASFFTPSSQKPKDAMQWSERSPGQGLPATLLVGQYQPEWKSETYPPKLDKIAAFDMVGDLP